jgi:hypothetical protein
MVQLVRSKPHLKSCLFTFYLVIAVRNTSAAHALCMVARTLFKVCTYSSDSRHRSHVWQQWHSVPWCIPKQCVAQVLIRCERLQKCHTYTHTKYIHRNYIFYIRNWVELTEYCNTFAGSISQWKFITLQSSIHNSWLQFTTLLEI